MAQMSFEPATYTCSFPIYTGIVISKVVQYSLHLLRLYLQWLARHMWNYNALYACMIFYLDLRLRSRQTRV